MIQRKVKTAIIGAGPGGYATAIRLRQLGEPVTLIESDKIGGTCLNRGCIPTKALLSATRTLTIAETCHKYGVELEAISLDIDKLNKWKDEVVERLRGGIHSLLASYEIEIIHGTARFTTRDSIEVSSKDRDTLRLQAENVVIATGSSANTLPELVPDGECILSPEEALDISSIPDRLLIIGGGAIGLELATIYQRMGSNVIIIEKEPAIMRGFDSDVQETMTSIMSKAGTRIIVNASLLDINRNRQALKLRFESPNGDQVLAADRIIVATGRSPNTQKTGLEQLGLIADERGFIRTDHKGETCIPGIYFVGDVSGAPYLAHKAYRDSVVVAESIAGQGNDSSPNVIPVVISAEVEAVRIGMTEDEAITTGIDIAVGHFPLSASGYAMANDTIDGFIKVIVNKATDKVLGVHMIGIGVSQMTGEATLAVELGMKSREFASVIRAHPTLSETLWEASLDAYSISLHILKV